jgi:membrane associated rhomboid family serine protease
MPPSASFTNGLKTAMEAQAASSSSIPPVTRYLLIWLPVSYFLCLIGLSHWLLKYLALIPTNSFLIHTYPWIMLTHVLVENNGLMLGIAVGTLATLGRRLEEEIGSKQYFAVLFICALTSSVGVIVGTAVLFSTGSMALYQYYSGFLPCVMGIVVGTWKRCPDEVLSVAFAPGVGLRARYLPLVAAGVCLVYELIFGHSAPSETEVSQGVDELFPGSDVAPALIALYWSWFYLRFLAYNPQSAALLPSLMPPASPVSPHHGDTGLCGLGRNGDPSPSFCFIAMFPPQLQPIIAPCSRVGFAIVRCFGLGGAVVEFEEMKQRLGQNADPNGGDNRDTERILIVTGAGAGAGAGTRSPADEGLQPLPGSSADEADRRRKIALEALQERLRQQSQNSTRPAAPVTAPAEKGAEP